MSFDAARLANVAVRGLRAYDPGHDLPALRRRFGAELAELGSNENPLGPSPHALAAARAALEQAHRYPDPRGGELRAALAARHDVDPGRIVLGNGSHELLILLAQCFAGPRQAVMYSQYGFAVFALAAAAVGAPAVEVPALPRDHPHAPLGHDLAAMADAMEAPLPSGEGLGRGYAGADSPQFARHHPSPADVRLIYLANPNNPTGTWFRTDALQAFLARVPHDTLVVVDEAYGEYMEAPGLGSALHFTDTYPNLIVTRTFSKAYALAGLRVGYLVADAGVAAVLERLRESFNVNAPALAAAAAALSDQDHLRHSLAFNRGEREWLAGELHARGYATLPSQTNFLLLDVGADAGTLQRHLFERGAIVRPMGGYGLPHTLRISLGSRADNRRLLDALP